VARNRMIRPEFWEDSKMAELSPYARLFYIAMWNFADDEGYLPQDFRWLKAKCLPYDKVSIQKLLNELFELKRIEIKNEIILIKNFLKYQRIDKPNKSDLKSEFAERSQISMESSPPKDKLREVKISKDKISNTLAAEPQKSEKLNIYHKFLSDFKIYYEKMTNQSCNINGKHYGLIKPLIDKHGIEAVIVKTELLCEHCRSQDIWFTKDGWPDFTIEKLSSQWNSLIPKDKGASKWSKLFADLEAENERLRNHTK
jgi:hypothetical protein